MELEEAILEETKPIGKKELEPRKGWQAKQREGGAGQGLVTRQPTSLLWDSHQVTVLPARLSS